MVRIEGPSDADRLDAAVRRLAGAHGLAIDVEGWTRRTYDLYRVESRLGPRVKVARVDSFATSSGEIELFDDRGLPFAEALGRELEQAFGLKEARIRRR
jgi:hypothetical protein